jgi:hypothetical protein
MNSMPGYGHRRHTAMSEFFVEIHVINWTIVMQYHHIFHTESSFTLLPSW